MIRKSSTCHWGIYPHNPVNLTFTAVRRQREKKGLSEEEWRDDVNWRLKKDTKTFTKWHVCVFYWNILSRAGSSNLSRYGTPYFCHRAVTAVHTMPLWNCSFPKEFKEFYFLKGPTNSQLIEKLSHSFNMFRHYCVILREFAVPCQLTQVCQMQ